MLAIPVLYLWTVYQRSLKTCPYFHITAFLITVLPVCCSCPCFSATFSRSFPFRKVLAEYPIRTVIQFSRYNRQTKKPIQRHQKSAGVLLSLQNDETMYRLWNSNPWCLPLNQPRRQTLRYRLVRHCSAAAGSFSFGVSFYIQLWRDGQTATGIIILTERMFVNASEKFPEYFFGE